VPRTKQRTPELRQHVLSIAVELIGGAGVEGFTARAIAERAHTSTAAVYELFGDKRGLLREVYFEGFRLLRGALDRSTKSDDALADLVAMLRLYRGFMRANPVLSELMFSRPFSDFAPGKAELAASGSVRTFVLARVRRAVDADLLSGDATDVAHTLVSLVQGFAAAEQAGRLGTSRKSIDRRWRLGVEAVLRGLSP
jgi:AcrR family transcriptional regulator